MLLARIGSSSKKNDNEQLWDFDQITTAGWWDLSDSSTLYDATTGGSLVAADGLIARIEDKSGNSRHWKQSTSGSRATRKASILNGLDIARFDGTDDGYTLDADLTLSSSNHTILMLFTPASTITDASSGRCIISGGTAGVGTAEYILFTGSVTGNLTAERLSHLVVQDTGLGVNVFGYGKTNANISGPNQVSFRWNNGSTTFTGRFNGSSDFATVSSAGGFASGRTINAIRYLGYRGFNNTAFSAFDLAELVIVDGILDNTTNEKAEGRLAHKWGQTASLPVGHPYKTDPPLA